LLPTRLLGGKMKRATNNCSICGKEKEITFTGEEVQYPIFTCPLHGPDSKNLWEEWLDKYKNLWQDDTAWDRPKDKLSCLVGFFFHYFKDFYGHPYVFSFANPIPYKDKDFIMARRILTMFNSDAKEARIYIKWVFAKRVRTSNYPVTSIGFLASGKFANEYFQAKAKSKITRRTTKLPEDFINWCGQNCPEIFEKREFSTWNDLNGLITHVKSYGMNNIEGKIINEAIVRNMLPAGVEYIKLEV